MCVFPYVPPVFPNNNNKVKRCNALIASTNIYIFFRLQKAFYIYLYIKCKQLGI